MAYCSTLDAMVDVVFLVISDCDMYSHLLFGVCCVDKYSQMEDRRFIKRLVVSSA